MTSILAGLSDLADFKANGWRASPEALAYEQHKQAQEQTAAQAQAAAAAAAQQATDASGAAAEHGAALQTAADERFSAGRLMKRIAVTTASLMLIFAVIGAMVVSGSVAANYAIKLPVPMRLVKFVYGAIFFFVYLPFYYTVDVWWRAAPATIYAVLPIRTAPYAWEPLNRVLSWTVIQGGAAALVA